MKIYLPWFSLCVQWLRLGTEKAVSITPDWLSSQKFTRIWCRRVDLWHITLIACFIIYFRLRSEHRSAKNFTRKETAVVILVTSLRIEATLVSLAKTYLEKCQKSMMKFFAKIVKCFKMFIIFAINLHHRCLAGFQIRLLLLLDLTYSAQRWECQSTVLL